MTITFLIPTYNASKHLVNCLSSIRRQNYDQDKIKIFIIDGGSNDNTLEIADVYNCRILHNPKKLAEEGLKIGMKEVETDLVVIFAADNELIGDYNIKNFTKVFPGFNIDVYWAKLSAKEGDKPINFYAMLLQSDPLSWFMKQLNPKLLIWGANGLVYRTEKIKKIWEKEGYIGDNDSFQELKNSGTIYTLYNTYPSIYHHHVETLIQWARKFSRNFSKHYLAHRNTRNMSWIIDKSFNVKFLAWIIYVLFPFSLIHSCFLAGKNKKIYWLYHPLVSFMQLTVYLVEYTIWKIKNITKS